MGNTYHNYACSEKLMKQLVEKAGFKSYRIMIATLSAEGLTISEIAKKVGASTQPFMAYHSVWINKNTKPLRLGG